LLCCECQDKRPKNLPDSGRGIETDEHDAVSLV